MENTGMLKIESYNSWQFHRGGFAKRDSRQTSGREGKYSLFYRDTQRI